MDDELVDHVKRVASKLKMVDLFNKDPKRAENYTIRLNAEDKNKRFILMDVSKNIANDETFLLLKKLAFERHILEKIKAMKEGKRINTTENQPVLHFALRNRDNVPVLVDKKDVMPEVNAVLEKMQGFVGSVRNGVWKGYTGKPITDVINIGIGGSDLGPQMVAYALAPFATKIKVHFISNVDGTQAVEVFNKINPETCLFIVSSKTFTTQETITNAESAKDWWCSKVGEANINQLKKHFVAVSTNRVEVEKFGIDTNNMFVFWNWVGGRFSLWSAIGLSVALYVGFDNFVKLLEGAHTMDEHFFTEKDPLKNMPMLLALVHIYNNNYLGYHNRAVLPYDQYLHRLPAYLQQLEMESNGKMFHKDGTNVLVYPPNCKVPIPESALSPPTASLCTITPTTTTSSSSSASSSSCKSVSAKASASGSVSALASAAAKIPAHAKKDDEESQTHLNCNVHTRWNNHTEVVVWGEAGTNGQHAFYQLIHQGTRVVPVDIIFPFVSHNPIRNNAHHVLLAANAFAQARALMVGKSLYQANAELKDIGSSQRSCLAHHKSFPGNRPSNMIIVDKVTPRTLGMLLALYEHKTFVEGAIWDINSFDQMGVELGKQLSNHIVPLLRRTPPSPTATPDERQKQAREEEAIRREIAKMDSSTAALMTLFREEQARNWPKPEENKEGEEEKKK